MRKSLKESLRGNNAKKIGKSCFKVQLNYFHTLSHLSYNIKVYFSEVRLLFEPFTMENFLRQHKGKIIAQNYHPPIRQSTLGYVCILQLAPIPTTPDYLENLRDSSISEVNISLNSKIKTF